MSDVKKSSPEVNSLFERILVEKTVKLEDCLVFEQELFDAIPMPVFLYDADGDYLGANRALADFLGVEREKIVEQGVYHFLAPDRAAILLQQDKELLSRGGRDSFEDLVVGKDGRELSVVFTKATVHDREGRTLGLVVTLFDLSELKEARRNLGEVESQRQAILDGFPDRVALIDCDLKVVWSNREKDEEGRICAVRGDQCCYHLLLGRESICRDCVVRRSIESGKIEFGMQEIELDGEGEREFFELVATPVKDRSGKVKSVVTIARDITERMKLERRVRHSQKMEAIGALAGGIAHDFNNVLTPIIGHAEIMRYRLRQSGQQDLEIEKSIGEILTAAKRAKALVDQILTFARAQEQNSVALYVHPIIKEVVNLIKAALPSTIEIRQEVDTSCGQVLMDPVQLHQVLMNLCTNSFHAMEGGVGTLTVRLARGVEGQDGRQWVVLSVADTGVGIEASVLPRIYEPYYTTKDKSRGTGMGLAMVHGIVSGCGGRVDVQSEVGVGTTFNVYLPVVAGASCAAEGVPAVVVPAGGKEHILVVDDEKAVLDVISNLLQGLGYTVTGRTSAQEALLLFMGEGSDFDLMITDFTMPVLTGVDLCIQVKKIRPDLPVILCTGDSEQAGDVLKRAGAADSFLKPVTLQGLAQVVRRALDRKASGLI